MSSKKKHKAKKAAKRKRLRPHRLAQRAAKLLDQRVSRARRQANALQVANLLKDGDAVPEMTEDEHVFWICHGCNYMASDHEEGVWSPIFDLYDGQSPPSPEDIAVTVMHQYADELEGDGWEGTPKAVLAWSVTDMTTTRIYKFEARRRLLERDADADIETLLTAPHNPVVWGLMNEVKQRSMAATPGDE